MAQTRKGPTPSKRAPSRLPLGSLLPVKLLSLDAVFQEFATVGRVLPEEKGRFCAYLSDLDPFMDKEVLRLMTSRLPPFAAHEIKALESDAGKLERTLNNYLKYAVQSAFSSKTWYERYKAQIRLAVKLDANGESPKKKSEF